MSTWDWSRESWLALSKELRQRWLQETDCSRNPPNEALEAAVAYELAERQLHGSAVAAWGGANATTAEAAE